MFHPMLGCDVVLNNLLFDEVTVQCRKHRSKRVNKKWRKRYGFKTISVPGQHAFFFGGKMFVHPDTWAKMERKLLGE